MISLVVSHVVLRHAVLLQDAPDLNGIVTSLTTELQGIMIAVGILGIILWAIAQLAAPLLPDWAGTIRGYFQRAMIALFVAGFASALVTWLYGLGSA